MKGENQNKETEGRKLKKERFRLLRQIDRTFEIPMIVLALIWVVLLVLELLKRSNPLLNKLSNIIWIIFIIDFCIKFIIAPSKLKFLKYNIIIIISLIVPAFRVFNIIRIAWLFKLTRTIVLIRIIGGMSRSIRALAMTMEKRAFGFISILTLTILFTGSAGIYVFERNSNPALDDYGSALWATAMVLCTMGADVWPITAEGRILCWLIAIYAFTIFGYVTATFATFFLGEDSQTSHPEIASGRQIEELQKEIKELKEMIIKNNNRT